MKDRFKKGSGSTDFGAITLLIMVPAVLVIAIIIGVCTFPEPSEHEFVPLTPAEKKQAAEDMEKLGELSKDFGTGLLWMSLFENNPELAGFLWITQNMKPGNVTDNSSTEPTVETTVPEICENCNEPCNTPYCAQCGEKQ